MTNRRLSSLVSVRGGVLLAIRLTVRAIGLIGLGLAAATVASVHAQDAKQGAAPKASGAKSAATATASATDSGKDSTASKAADTARAGGSTSYDFEDDLLQGDLVRPDGENLLVRRRGARESLIKIREHFIPELLKSVENL
jgi:hypothetical protein